MKLKFAEAPQLKDPKTSREYRRAVVTRRTNWKHVTDAVNAGVLVAYINGRNLQPKELRRYGVGASDGLESLYRAGGAVFFPQELEQAEGDLVEAAARRIVTDIDTPYPHAFKPKEGLPTWMDSVLWSKEQMEGVVSLDDRPRLRTRIAELKAAADARWEKINEDIRVRYEEGVAAGTIKPHL